MPEESMPSTTDGATIVVLDDVVPVGEVIRLSDGRLVTVVAVADSVAGGEPPPPPEPDEHIDVWWWSVDGEWVKSQQVTGDPPPGADYTLPRDEEQAGLPYVYHYTAAHTFGCEDHKPTDPPEFP